MYFEYNQGRVKNGVNDDYDDTYKFPPAAIFADYINMLSNAWIDKDQSFGIRTRGAHTWMNASVITNNITSHVTGIGGTKGVESSEGAHNLIRFNENWSSTFHLRGSNVVMNTRRYSRSPIAYSKTDSSKKQDVYDPPSRDFRMNADLFERSGQPPFSPYGVQVMRAVSTVEVGR